MASPTPTVGQWALKIPYAHDNFLQTYDVYLVDQPAVPSSTVEPAEKIWFIYIHGGFFRDVLVDSASLHPAVSLLTATAAADSSVQKNIAGFASLNYRLSPSAKVPQDPSTPAFDLRAAVWPQHLDDVCAGIRHLQAAFSFGANYILAGHSVGATVALLAAIKGKQSHGIIPPKAVLGLSGIYDFPLLHESHPEYEALTFNAMKRGEEVAASPAIYDVQTYKEAGVSQVLLAHSKDDGLVPWNQVEAMETVLVPGGEGYVRVLELFGKHNQIWADGTELSRAVTAAVESLVA
ncbi:hypothetical protein A1O3_07817 [Capronia epimyces CBS 606.96]|uniref:Alpha/beta hydrolase fold-3 domain-containing protein n=1 Tax=Capronia epimyces CBS 606.96 TaxID=1182542 RepID=W9XH38_9EURO|nr:uncharacterized protein A1O3_07817 [Capronia epimyces CBS 606.96]EXJ79538.1 hypothetical protein A1O3_07817 [Capronia epimyces CBS 606.96]